MSNNILKRLIFDILLGLLVCCTKSAAWKTENVVTLLPQPIPETFSIVCQDQMIKVDSNIYHLDRLRLSLRSDYFERLFTNTSDDFKIKSNKVLKIQIKNGEVFPDVVDLIHERKRLIDVMKKQNYLPLLEMMNHLEMEINLTTFSYFIDNISVSYSPEDAKIFKLYKFIRKNQKLEYLLTSVFKYLSKNLTKTRNHKIFPSMPLGHLIRIIKSVEYVNDERSCEIIKMCTKWLCYELKNRLSYLAILVNSIKPKFHSGSANYEKNNFLAKCLPKSNVDRKTKQKTISGCLFALLAHDGHLNPTIYDREELQCGQHYAKSKSKCELELSTEVYNLRVYKEPKESPNLVYRINERYKWRKFLNNGDLYDITVRVGEKTYKLHRRILESRCGYFADIFRAEYSEAMAKCDGTPKSPLKDKEYSLDGVDQSAFGTVIDHIYFIDIDLNDYKNIARIFITADILKIDTFLTILIEWLKQNHKAISSLDVVEMLNYTYGKKQYDDLYLLYLSKHMSSSWPEIYNMSEFCSVSWSMLENMLKSPHFCFDDKHKILDICSTWVFHDVKNRYSFLPRIARIINPIYMTDQDEYKNKTAVELNNCSLQFVRDELWNILSIHSNNIAPSSKDLKKSTPKRLEELPVFIRFDKENKLHQLLNADLDIIISFPSICKNRLHGHFYHITATIINDNIFILQDNYHHRSVTFEVYNFSLNKSFALPFDLKNPRREYQLDVIFTLLNCKNELYCTMRDGEVMKYSIQLNQWTIISKDKLYKSVLLFTSDGQQLYRMYEVSKGYGYSNYIVEPYDFDKNIWSRETSLPLINNIHTPGQLSVVVNGHDLVVATHNDFISFDRETKTWSQCVGPYENVGETSLRLFAQCDDRRLLWIKNKLYNFSPPNGTCELKKELSYELLWGQTISVIHSPKVCINQP